MLSRTLLNIRYAVRSLRRQPVAAATILLTLAVGTGATLATFSIVDAALLRPLPYPEPDRLVSVVQLSEEFGETDFAPPFLEDLRAGVGSFASIAGFSSSGWLMTVTGRAEPRVVGAAYITDGLLEMLGATPAMGRSFAADEQLPDGRRAAIVSASLWATLFGAGEQLDGQVITIGGDSFAVVGVLPRAFSLPMTGSIVSANRASADILLPFESNFAWRLRNVPIMKIIGRLAESRGIPEAAAELDTLAARFAREYPDAGLAASYDTASLAERVTRDSRRTVLLLFGAAGMLLLIGCVNIANIMLTRAASRGHEMSVRAALGAGRARLAEQVVVEAMVFAAIGCGTGFVLARGLIAAAPALGLQALPPSAQIAVDGRVAAVAALLALGCAAIFGLVPTLQSARVTRGGWLGAGTRTATARARRLHGAMVVTEVAVALFLLVGAGLLSASFMRLTSIDPGFDTEGLTSIPLSIGDAGYGDATARGAFMFEFVYRLQRLPAVERAAAVNRLPLGGANVLVQMEAEEQVPPESTSTADRRVVTPGYFEAMGIPLLSGRGFESGDDAQSDFGAAIVNETAARAYWPGADPVGRQARIMLRSGPGPWLTVVGLVADIRHHGLDQPARPEIYVPYQQASVETMVALVRTAPGTRISDAGLHEAIRQQAWAMNEDLPMDRIESVESIVRSSVSQPRLRTVIATAFAALALTLAAIGVAGVISHGVVQRARELAIRQALGARADQILWGTVREGLVLGAVGAGIGLLAAARLSLVLEELLFETGARDPLTFAAVTAALLLIVGVASYLPARRATRVDPAVALQAD